MRPGATNFTRQPRVMSGIGTATADKAHSIKQRADKFLQDSAGHLDGCSPDKGLQLLAFVHGGKSSGDSQFEGLLKTALRDACAGLSGQDLADATQAFGIHVGQHLAKRFLGTSCHDTYTQFSNAIAGRTAHQSSLRDWLATEAKPKTDAEAEAEALSSLDVGLQQLDEARVDLYLLQQEEHAAKTRLLSRAANLPGDTSSGVAGPGPAPTLTATTTTMTVPAAHTLTTSISNASQVPGGHAATAVGITATASNADDGMENTEALIHAIYQMDTTTIQSLMQKDRECGVLALCKRAEAGDAFCVARLLDLGVNVNATNAGESMLYAAAKSNRSDVVRLLVSRGAKDVSNALVYAARYGDLKLCKFLMKHKGSVHHDNGDATPLLAAVRNGNVDVAKLLFKHGAKLDRKENDGRSILVQAYTQGGADMCKLFVKQGAHLDFGDEDGNTALMLAAAKGDIDTAKILLKAGASHDLVNSNKQTAYAVATKEGHTAFAAWLQVFTKRRKL